MTGERTSERDDGVGPGPDAAGRTGDAEDREPAAERSADPGGDGVVDDVADRVGGMKGAAVSVGPRGEIVLDRPPSGGAPRADPASGNSVSRPEPARTAEPDQSDDQPSIAVNQEPSS